LRLKISNTIVELEDLSEFAGSSIRTTYLEVFRFQRKRRSATIGKERLDKLRMELW
jgi:hypothetical protein